MQAKNTAPLVFTTYHAEKTLLGLLYPPVMTVPLCVGYGKSSGALLLPCPDSYRDFCLFLYQDKKKIERKEVE